MQWIIRNWCEKYNNNNSYEKWDQKISFASKSDRELIFSDIKNAIKGKIGLYLGLELEIQYIY